MTSYDTVSQAINGLRARGYDKDFNIAGECLVCHEPVLSLGPDEFTIVEFYRFEGESDPGDEAVVYAIESRKGDKGVLVNGFGASADTMSDDMIRKLQIDRDPAH